jgi:DNA-binding LytR/AlgR family response regulator
LILDDELPGLTYLKMLCEQLPDLEVVKAFNNAELFVQEIPNLIFDICILDIEMPKMNGIEVAKLLNNKPVIFTTAYKEYAVDAFEVNAVDYVLKPVKLERLQQAIAKVMLIKPTSLTPKTVQLNSEKGKAIITINKISYIVTSETDSRDKTIWFEDRSSLKIKNISFEKLQEILPRTSFIRVNKKEIISLQSILSFSSEEIVTNILLANGKNLRVTLSETYKDEFIKHVKI